MSWWMWGFTAVVGLVALFELARRSYLAGVRREIIGLFSERARLKLARQSRLELEFVDEDGDPVVFRLGSLLQRISEAKANSPEARRPLYLDALQALEDGKRILKGKLSLDRDGESLMPRLVLPGFPAAQGDLPSRALPQIGLAVVYVLDTPHAVIYVSPEHLGALGLSLEALHERALANLRKRTPGLEKVVGAGTLAVLKALDTYDAARLLLLPEQLQEGEEVAAMVPDRDTLVVAPLPGDGDWSSLNKLARASAGPALLDKPLRVSRAGLRLAS